MLTMVRVIFDYTNAMAALTKVSETAPNNLKHHFL